MLSKPEHRNSSLAWPSLLVKNIAEERVEPLCQHPGPLGFSDLIFLDLEGVIRDLSLFYQFLKLWMAIACPFWDCNLGVVTVSGFVLGDGDFFFWCLTSFLTIQSSISRSLSCSSGLQRVTTVRTKSSKSFTCCKDNL